VYPRVDLQVAHLFGGEPKLNPAVGAYESGLSETAGVFDRQPEQPFRERPPANFAFMFFHFKQRYKPGVIVEREFEPILQASLDSTPARAFIL
jgi:hypothetical protein